ncbi:MAG: HDOD domain-containing protein [Deltaproteobacteria bacterium]|jgi:HD-like signal output (HDOD) protein/ActR/RegA family two-component response regulator|nr:HDOD domain-containing protein [Deltaproteobacteria bacterium]
MLNYPLMNDQTKRRILFVDDEPMVLKGLQRSLRKMRTEWEMRFTASSKEALDILGTEPFDVIVSDLRMPEMDGAQLLDEVKRQHPQIVRIILSGQVEQETTFKSVQLAHQSLSKPCDADVLKHTLNKLFGLRNLLEDESIKRIVSQIETLPSLPAIYSEVIDELQAAAPSVQKIGDIISTDLAMTAKILQVVNSAFFGLVRKISNPKEAVMLLGTETIKALVLSVKIFSEFNQKKYAWFNFDALFNHSISVSMFAQTISKEERLDKYLVNNSLMAGMFHDLGKLILVTNFQESYQKILIENRKNNQHLWELERDMFGTSHAEIGAYLMGLWGLDYPVIEAIAFHHCPGKSLSNSTGLLTAVHFGDAFSRLKNDENSSGELKQLDRGYLDNLGIGHRIDKWQLVCQDLAERKV